MKHLCRLAAVCAFLGTAACLGLAGPDDDLKGIVFVDAGSTGSKIFSFGSPQPTDERNEKASTFCTSRNAVNQPLLGLSALLYNVTSCLPVLQTSKNRTELRYRSDYAPALLDAAKAIHEHGGPCGASPSSCKPPLNKDAIPIHATGGMRLLSAEDNAKVWKEVCGRTHGGYTHATRESRHCGTLPGTREAWYEYIASIEESLDDANVSGGDDLWAMFTMGGASAQLALPLTKKHAQVFGDIKHNEALQGACKKATLSDGKPMPVFSRSATCVDDFLSTKRVDQIPDVYDAFKRKLASKDIVQIGLVSFLGLGKGSHAPTKQFGIAGGVESIENWARSSNCGRGQESADAFDECQRKLRRALESDPLWVAVKDFLKNHDLGLSAMHFNSAAVDPRNQMGAPDIGEENVKKLQQYFTADATPRASFEQGVSALSDHLAEKCVEGGIFRTRGFGYEQGNTCMKTQFLIEYYRLAFAHPGSSARARYDSAEWSEAAHVRIKKRVIGALIAHGWKTKH